MYLEKNSNSAENKAECLDVDDPDFWTKNFGEDSLEIALFQSIEGSIDDSLILGKARIRNKEINYEESSSGENAESGDEKDNESYYSSNSESDDDLRQHSPQKINQSSKIYFYYSSIIPIIGGSLFLTLAPCFLVEGIGYGAKVISYRKRKNGLKGPAEELGLILELGDILLEVNNDRIDWCSFLDIMKRLRDLVVKRSEVNICFYTPTGKANTLNLGARKNKRTNPYRGPNIYSRGYVSPESMFPGNLNMEFQLSKIIIYGLEEVKKRLEAIHADLAQNEKMRITEKGELDSLSNLRKDRLIEGQTMLIVSNLKLFNEDSMTQNQKCMQNCSNELKRLSNELYELTEWQQLCSLKNQNQNPLFQLK